MINSYLYVFDAIKMGFKCICDFRMCQSYILLCRKGSISKSHPLSPLFWSQMGWGSGTFILNTFCWLAHPNVTSGWYPNLIKIAETELLWTTSKDLIVTPGYPVKLTQRDWIQTSHYNTIYFIFWLLKFVWSPEVTRRHDMKWLFIVTE